MENVNSTQALQQLRNSVQKEMHDLGALKLKLESKKREHERAEIAFKRVDDELKKLTQEKMEIEHRLNQVNSQLKTAESNSRNMRHSGNSPLI